MASPLSSGRTSFKSMNFNDFERHRFERRHARRPAGRPGMIAALLGALAVLAVFGGLAALYAIG